MVSATGVSYAQTTASQVVPGSYATSGTNCTVGPCFVPNSTTNPLYVTSSASSPTSVTTTPGQRTLVTLDVKTVTTGGTAVTALISGHRTAGGIICNPGNATINLGVNEIGTASGTTSSGDTTFIIPGQCYNLSPAAGAVSVITSDSAHPFSGYGLQ